jgi:hypothetical protein
MPGLQEILPEPGEDSNGKEDANDPGYEADDIQNIYADGLDIDLLKQAAIFLSTYW